MSSSSTQTIENVLQKIPEEQDLEGIEGKELKKAWKKARLLVKKTLTSKERNGGPIAGLS